MSNIVGYSILRYKFKGGEGGMDAAQGIHEDEVCPRLVMDHDGEGPQGRKEPYLAGAGREGGVRGPACPKGMDGCR